jgi:hypothetical protein
MGRAVGAEEIPHLRYGVGGVGEWVELFEEGVEGHRMGRPFRAWKMWGAWFLGRCPRLSWDAPLALKKFRIFATASGASANGSNFLKKVSRVIEWDALSGLGKCGGLGS